MVNQRPVNAIIKFITSFSSPEEVLVFKPSTEIQERLTELLYEQKLRNLTTGEHRELEYFMIVENILCTARFEAQGRLAA